MADPCRSAPYPEGRTTTPPADLLDRLPAAFVLLDVAWRVTYANAGAEHLLSRPYTYLVGRTVWLLGR